MKRTIAFALALFVALSLAACAPAAQEPHTETDEKPVDNSAVELMNMVHYPEAIGFDDYDAQRSVRAQNELDERFIAAMQAFAFDTAVPVLGTTEGNANFSPVSLYLALSLGATGAKSETQKEMLSLLGVDDETTLREQCARLYRLLYTDNEIGKLKIANSLWLDGEIQGRAVNFKDEFCRGAADDFYASIFMADFSDEEAGRAMAKWVSDNTNGTLSPDFPPDPDKLMSILNTVYFYDEWIDAFHKDNTKPAVFHAAAGDVEADFMNRMTSGSFNRGESFTRAALGMKNRSRMVFILPDEGVSVYDLLANDTSVEMLFHGGTEEYGEITWSIPKFSYGCKYELADALRALGMATAFEPDAADFTGITDSPAWLSNVTQQTHIAIDERGVEASAYTELGYAGAGMPQGRADMILDRPFLFGIIDNTGAPLFMGVCADPTDRN